MFDTISASGEPDEIGGLNADAVLERAAAGRRRINLDQAEQLALAAHWADLHGVVGRLSKRPGQERLVERAGEGSPAFAEFAPAELGAVLGLSVTSAGFLMADALDLRHRLPRLWREVQQGEVKVWVARKVAARTRKLSQAAAAKVDVKVAPLAATLPYGRLEKVLDAAILTADREQAKADTAESASEQGVWLGKETVHGHGTIFGRAAMPDVQAVDRSLNKLARAMTVLGDTDSLDVRRAKALGVLADPAAALELTRLANEALDAINIPVRAGRSGNEPQRPEGTDPRRGCDLGRAVMYVHLSQESLDDATSNGRGNGTGVARVLETGPALLDQVRGWLAHRQVTVKPVIDIAEVPAADCYEATAAIAEGIRLRTPADCFPYSSNIGIGGDNDHTKEFVSTREGGPPGQTSVPKMGRMARHTHRIKTHSGWTVTQPRSGIWVWRSPRGYFFLVDQAGTTSLGRL